MTSTRVDLLASGRTSLGTANAVTGSYGSFELKLENVRFRGTASKQGRSVAFAFDTGAFSPAEPLEGAYQMEFAP